MHRVECAGRTSSPSSGSGVAPFSLDDSVLVDGCTDRNLWATLGARVAAGLRGLTQQLAKALVFVLSRPHICHQAGNDDRKAAKGRPGASR